MKKIAIVYGGNSLESDISVLTALKVAHEFQNNGWDYLLVYLDHDGNFYTGKALLNKLNYENFHGFKKGEFKRKHQSSFFKTKTSKLYFDYALIVGHGKGIEDGTLGAFFDTLKIPCIYSGIYNAAILQDKVACKRILNTFKIPQTKFKSLSASTYLNIQKLDSFIKPLHFPLIVKPCHLGSSIGVRKVMNIEELKEAIEAAFYYDDEVIVEEAINHLKEVNIAILGNEEKMIISSLETVNNHDMILSFYDKYESGEDKKFVRIIPSDVSEDIEETIRDIAIKSFRSLSCFGVVRFDFLYDQQSQKVYLNEINTIPGSLAYYLFEDKGIEFKELLTTLVDIGIKRIQKLSTIEATFEKGFLSNLSEKIK